MPFSEKLQQEIDEFKRIEPKERRDEIIKSYAAQKQAALNLALEGKSLEEISEEMGIVKGAVSTYIRRVLLLSRKSVEVQLELGKIWKKPTEK